MFKVGNKFGRRGRHPEGREVVRCFILLMKRRSNLRTVLIGVGDGTTTSAPKRGAARERMRLAAKAADDKGARFGRGPKKNWHEAGKISCASTTRTSRGVHGRRAELDAQNGVHGDGLVSWR